MEISAEAVAGSWRVEVCDNGIGIPAEGCVSAFQPFKRLHERGAHEGTGLGLSICQRIVQHHGGKIGAEAPNQGGTRIWFTIPSIDG